MDGGLITKNINERNKVVHDDDLREICTIKTIWAQYLVHSSGDKNSINQIQHKVYGENTYVNLTNKGWKSVSKWFTNSYRYSPSSFSQM